MLAYNMTFYSAMCAECKAHGSCGVCLCRALLVRNTGVVQVAASWLERLYGKGQATARAWLNRMESELHRPDVLVGLSRTCIGS